MAEIYWKNNESLKKEHTQSKEISKENSSLEVPKKELLESYENYETFVKTLEQRNDKDKILQILGKITNDELQEYIDLELEWNNLFNNELIDSFIDKFWYLLEEENSWVKINSITEINKSGEIFKENSTNVEKIKEDSNEKSKEKAKEAHKYLKENLSKYEGINTDFDSKIAEIEWLYKKWDIESLKKINEILVDFFSDKTKKDKFFNELAKKQPELYNDTLDKLSNLSPDLELLLQDQPRAISEWIQKISNTDNIALVSNFPEWEKVTKNWEIISSWDKYIDFGKNPPIAYIKSDNWFRLKTEFYPPNTMDIRAEYQKAKLEFEPNIKQTKERIEQVENKINETNFEQGQLKTRLKVLQTLPETTENNLEIEETKKHIEKNEISLEKLNLKLNLEKDALKLFEEKLKQAKNKYDKEMQETLLKSKEEIKKRDNEVRERKKFLESSWFWIFPESITNLIFNLINRHKGIINLNMWGNEIKWRIDLSKWLFGWDRITWKDSDVNKTIFLSLFNKIISWNPWEPIDVNALIKWSKSNWFASKAELVEILKKNWIMNDIWTFNITKIEENLLNSENKKID